MYNLILPILLLVCCSYVCSLEVDTYDFLMPNVWPHKDELYLCSPIRISPRNNYYIVGFEPNATMHTAHHMLLYGCTEPGTDDPVWSCGEMQSNEIDQQYNSASPCRSGSQEEDPTADATSSEDGNLPGSRSELPFLWTNQLNRLKVPDFNDFFSGISPSVVYAWARDAPSLHLPKDVGFHIGKDSTIKYLVLQIHYMHRFPQDKTDNSGVFIKYTKQTMPRQAGVILLGTGGELAPHKVEHMETACTINEDKVIHPFAFRTHTHGLGVVVSGYAVRKDDAGDTWRLIGKKSPQLPQMFYPVVSTAVVRRGDILAARCTMNNTRDHTVRVGATNQDEMCNFYLMYWVENDSPLNQKYCFSAGPPFYYWNRARENFNRIPDLEASTL